MPNKAVFVLLDGLQSVYAKEHLGYLEHLSQTNRAAKYEVLGNLPSSSRPMYETIFTGVEAYEHGITNNGICRLSNQKHLFELLKQAHKKSLPHRIFKKIGKAQKEETFRGHQIAELSMQAVQYITVLKLAGIPMEYWTPDAMNWVLIRWGQRQTSDYRALFSRYDTFIEETKSGTEKLRLKNRNRQFHHNLKKLLSYALEA